MIPNTHLVVSKQIPEYIREEYPTFVAFVEAYYEYLESQGVDFSTVRDIDETLEDFVTEFKKELAHNLPFTTEDERFLLQRIKDQYLSKGSEASYKLLFRLLFGKTVELAFPGRSMLRASDGRWNQDLSVFVKIDYGDPEDIVGKLVDIKTPTRTLRVLIDRRQDIVGEIDRIVAITNNIYEFFLDRKFVGKVSPGDVITYKDQFQGIILPTTSKLKISQAGKNFRVGQLFELKSGGGTGALFKVTRTDTNGGIKSGEFIKYGINYTTNFSVSVLASNDYTTRFQIPLTSSTSRAGNDVTINDRTLGFNEQGYISSVNYVTQDYVDGAYAGDVLKQFSLIYQNAQTDSDDPAIIDVSLDAIAKYPGYYENNSGFLSDAIFLQDSKYYQAFSYVVKITEKLDRYKTAVRTMVHPAGMALFGEYNIRNDFDLSIELQSLIRSLGIGLDDSFPMEDLGVVFSVEKVLSTPLNQQDDFHTIVVTKILSPATLGGDYNDLVSLGSNSSILFTKAISAAAGFANEIATPTDNITNKELGKSLSTDYSGAADFVSTKAFGKRVDDFVIGSDEQELSTNKYIQTTSVGTLQENGYVVVNPYEQGGYFSEIYVNTRNATFTS